METVDRYGPRVGGLAAPPPRPFGATSDGSGYEGRMRGVYCTKVLLGPEYDETVPDTISQDGAPP
jgi:hypothetical protein